MNVAELDAVRNIGRYLPGLADLADGIADTVAGVVPTRHAPVSDLIGFCKLTQSIAGEIASFSVRAQPVKRSGRFASELNRAGGHAQALARTLGCAHELALASDRNGLIGAKSDLVLRLTRASEVARALADDLHRARARADVFVYLADARGQHGARRVTPKAIRLLAAAASLLPAAGRARYRAEYWSELWELAHGGTGRGGQLRYAVRQLVSAWHLRAELRAPRPRRAAP